MSRDEIVDIYTPAAPDSLRRSLMLNKPGLWRIARRDAEFYSIMIVAAGAFGRACVMDGEKRPVWFQPSSFTGSFVLNGGVDGIIIELDGILDFAPNITVDWREEDARIV